MIQERRLTLKFKEKKGVNMNEVNNDILTSLIESLNEILKSKHTSDEAIMSSDISSLGMALSKAQSVIENVSKDKQAYGYKYADLANCLAAIKKPLADNDLSISQIVSVDTDKKPVLITLLIHKSGQWLKSTFPIENVVTKQGNSLQHLGAGLTYTRRYALSAIVGLTQEDDDAQSLTKNKPEELVIKSAQQLSVLCKESNLNSKEFAIFHNIKKEKPESIINGVNNFELLKQQYIDHGKI